MIGQRRDTTSAARSAARTRRGPLLPFLPLIPAIVVLVGLAVSAAITRLGMAQLREQSVTSTALHTRALALTLAERLRATPVAAHDELIDRVVERITGEVLLVEPSTGRILHDASLAPPSPDGVRELVRLKAGQIDAGLGRSRFFAAELRKPHDDRAVVVMLQIPDMPFATSSMVESASVFTLLLVGTAGFVAYYLARSVHSDVRYVRDSIVAMASPEGEPVAQSIAVRAIDQVGRLTVAFNRLVERYAEAEQAYRKDLSRALSYERERSEFLAALSHELRTPLNVVLGFTDVLLSEVDGPLSQDAKDNLQIVRQSGLHLRSLINDILDLSGLETGRVNLTLMHTDIREIAEQVVKEKQVAARSKNLVIALDGEPVHAVADKLRVRQVLGNLVSNAIKFTSAGRVLVTVRAVDGEVAIAVTDTGAGIATEDQALVFEEYRQSGDWQSRGAGSGLGLAITRRLVRMHGGRIELQSQVGTGSRFTVFLPLEGPPRRTVEADPTLARGNTLQMKAATLSLEPKEIAPSES